MTIAGYVSDESCCSFTSLDRRDRDRRSSAEVASAGRDADARADGLVATGHGSLLRRLFRLRLLVLLIRLRLLSLLMLLLPVLMLVFAVAVLGVVLRLILLRQRFGDLAQQFQCLLLIGECARRVRLAELRCRGSRMLLDLRPQLNRFLQRCLRASS